MAAASRVDVVMMGTTSAFARCVLRIEPLRRHLFALLMLASGFCGISYEVLYGRIFGNLIGDQFLVSATVLLVFLLGIAFGTLSAYRLWRWLWLIEATIGGWGVLFAFGAPTLDAALYAIGAGPQFVLTVCFTALAPPAFLIGTSVPIFAGYASRVWGGKPFARVYAIYNVGAALTAIAIEFVLLRAFGLRGAVLAVASLNGLVGIGLRFGFGALRSELPHAGSPLTFPRKKLAAIALASVASAIFQLTMIRIAESLFGPFRETFALVLCLVLLGIAVGSWLVERLSMRLEHVLALAVMSLVALLVGLRFIALGYAAFAPAASHRQLSAVLAKCCTLVLSMGAPSICFGATVPAVLTEQRHVARESGELLFVSSIANALGFLAMAVVLHRALDYGALLALVAFITGAAWVAARGRLDRSLPAVALLATVLLVARRFVWNERLLYLGYTSFQSSTDLRAAERNAGDAEIHRGAQDVFSITWSAGRPHFFINGYVSVPLDAPSERVVGAFSSLFAPRPDTALVLGVGSGATAGVLSLLFADVTAVEINPLVLEHLDGMAAYNFGLARRPHARIVHDDAIHFAKADDHRYSLIVNTVTSPLYFSSSKLYTLEFMDVMRQRLEPDGVYVTWFDSRIGDRGADIVLTTAKSAFAECWLGAVKSTYYLLVCSPTQVRLQDVERAAHNPELADYLRGQGIAPDQLAYGVLSTQAFGLIHDPAAPLNTMNTPELEFEIARLRRRGIHDLKQRIARGLKQAELDLHVTSAFAFDPLVGAAYIEGLIGKGDLVSRRYREVASVEASIRP